MGTLRRVAYWAIAAVLLPSAAVVVWLLWQFSLAASGHAGERGTLVVAECVRTETQDTGHVNDCHGAFVPDGSPTPTGTLTLSRADELYPEGTRVAVRRDGDAARTESVPVMVLMLGLTCAVGIGILATAAYHVGAAVKNDTEARVVYGVWIGAAVVGALWFAVVVVCAVLLVIGI
ncbi:hypothetical protein V5P93_004545 [Actinokineospora auranticolor]|uniref:Uncharacterized protein n=1 Tax=Actinokineospora auranticolor TaxID=155976 RepID=A0A2S6GT31_9PSEU|nr:hypothetical protein [Actinokineospora auranticolor]PPK68349.1 hypothetical protein CLV40_10572 [Actinokineospora auranticolor]